MAGIKEAIEGVSTAPFARWHDEYGVDCLLFDVDGTLVPLGSDEVPHEIVARLVAAREQNLYRWLGLVTHNPDPDVIRAVAEQVGSDAEFAPRNMLPHKVLDRKPRPTMVHMALGEFGVGPSQTAIIGDKHSKDVRAGVRAGLAVVAWTDRLGDARNVVARGYERLVEEPRWNRLARKGPTSYRRRG